MSFLVKKLDSHYRKYSKHFQGQEAHAYGYAAIVLPDVYMQDRYGDVHVIDQHILEMDSRTIRELTNIERSCSVIASARLLSYLSSVSIEEFLNKSFYYARRKLFSPRLGTIPFFLSSILNKLIQTSPHLERYKAHASYAWNFELIKSCIDANLPLIMNIMRGYYANHSITICGYKTYRTHRGDIHLLAIYDGWHKGVRYLDLSAFETDYCAGAVASFNWIAPR